MEPAAAPGHGWLSARPRVSQIQGFLQRGGREIFKPPAEQERDHFENYVDSPLCRGASTHLVLQSGFTG